MTNESKRDWENFFKPEDFDFSEFKSVPQRTPNELCAEQANAVIRKELEKAPRVYGTFTEDLKRAKFSGPLDWTERYHPQPSHTARLICIEEIKRD